MYRWDMPTTIAHVKSMDEMDAIAKDMSMFQIDSMSHGAGDLPIEPGGFNDPALNHLFSFSDFKYGYMTPPPTPDILLFIKSQRFIDRAHQMDKLADLFLAEVERSTFASDSSYSITRLFPSHRPCSPPKLVSNHPQGINESAIVMPRPEIIHAKFSPSRSSSISALELPGPKDLKSSLVSLNATKPAKPEITKHVEFKRSVTFSDSTLVWKLREPSISGKEALCEECDIIWKPKERQSLTKRFGRRVLQMARFGSLGRKKESFKQFERMRITN